MPAYIDARNSGLDLTFSRGTARNVPFVFPVGTLVGRTFTATLDGVGLSTAILTDTLTVTVSVAQTLAAGAGLLPFVLTETTGVDQPIVIGTWRASTRPNQVTPPFTVTVSVNAATVTIGVVSGTEFPELAAADPSELGLVTAGGVTTLSVLDTIARTPLHRAGEYYANYSHSLSANQTMTQDFLRLQPVFLSKGTVDRIGVEVNTAVASLICRLGVYTDDGGLPLARIAEAASTADCSTTGVKDLTISAVIPKNGRYWLASVTQAAAGGALRTPSSGHTQVLPFPAGTAAPSGSTSYLSRGQTGVTGALPSTVTSLVSPASALAHLVHYRYSSVG